VEKLPTEPQPSTKITGKQGQATELDKFVMRGESKPILRPTKPSDECPAMGRNSRTPRKTLTDFNTVTNRNLGSGYEMPGA